jgi:hypothetical protein
MMRHVQAYDPPMAAFELDTRLCICGHPGYVHAHRERMAPEVAAVVAVVCASCPASGVAGGCREFTATAEHCHWWTDAGGQSYDAR